MSNLNLDNINFLNENILISTKNGREKMKEFSSYINEIITERIKVIDNCGKLIIPTAKKILDMDDIKILEYITKPSMLESLNNINISYKKILKDFDIKIHSLSNKYKYIKSNTIHDLDIVNPIYSMRSKRILNRADIKNEEVAPAFEELIRKCSPGGEYDEALKNINEKYYIKELYMFNKERIFNIINTKMDQSAIKNVFKDFVNTTADFILDIEVFTNDMNAVKNNFKQEQRFVQLVKLIRKIITMTID